MTLSTKEFVRRFLMHVLPKGFVKIRHFGILSNRSKEKSLSMIRNLLRAKVAKLTFKPLPDFSVKTILKEVFGHDITRCKNCGKPLTPVIQLE